MENQAQISTDAAHYVAQIKKQILNYIDLGVIPSKVANFGDLHDYMDANTLGGFCEDAIFDGISAHFRTAEDDPETMPQGAVNFINEVQTAVSEWIEQGGIHAELKGRIRQYKIRVTLCDKREDDYFLDEEISAACFMDAAQQVAESDDLEMGTVFRVIDTDTLQEAEYIVSRWQYEPQGLKAAYVW